LTEADKAILAATDECLAGNSISDAAGPRSQDMSPTGEQVEFIIAMGNLDNVFPVVSKLRIPLAEGVAVWPPMASRLRRPKGWG